MVEGSVNYSYDSLQARTIRGLRLAMLKNNARHGMSFEYKDFQFINGRWYCWFRLEIKGDDSLFKQKDRGDNA